MNIEDFVSENNYHLTTIIVDTVVTFKLFHCIYKVHVFNYFYFY